MFQHNVSPQHDSPPPPPQYGSPPASPYGPPPKKGMSTGAKVGIGCGIVLIICVIAVGLLVKSCFNLVNDFSKDMQKNPERKIAELVIDANPDLTVVSSNDTTGEMTIRDDKTGKAVTMSFKDIASGKFSITDDQGNTTHVGGLQAQDVPGWVPVYTGATLTGGYKTEQGGKASGAAMMQTSDTPEKVVEFYENATSGWPSRFSSKSNVDIGSMKQSQVEISSGGRKLVIIAQRTDQGTTITVQFSEN